MDTATARSHSKGMAGVVVGVATACAAVLALSIGGAALTADAAGGSLTPDQRYARAVADSGFDPADGYWADFAQDTCRTLRAGSGPAQQVSDVGVHQIAYIYGSAVGAYCKDQAAHAAAWFHGRTADFYGAGQ